MTKYILRDKSKEKKEDYEREKNIPKRKYDKKIRNKSYNIKEELKKNQIH